MQEYFGRNQDPRLKMIDARKAVTDTGKKRISAVSQIMTKNQIRDYIIAQVETMPPLPSLVTQIMQMISDEKSCAGSFESLFRKDPILTARLLRLVNSSFFGFRNKVSSIPQAIVMVGYESLKNLVLAASISRFVKGSYPGYGYKDSGLWQHSFLTATWAERLAVALGWSKNESQCVFVSGLLHDIGKLIMSSYLTEHIREMLISLIEAEGDLVYAEKHVVGIDHAEIGACIAEKWNFSPRLIDVIKHHHITIKDRRSDGETALLKIVDHVINRSGIGMYNNFPITHNLDTVCLANLGINANVLLDLQQEIIKSSESLVSQI
ncbi:MAG: HDOD domain-containing protein [Candidatus Auribacterota bacterium]|jgi:putative nucleotidyltransferase with HDIG domain|nr:HDOD domain-containing protein [Candidatus Auribacterota bacterium]